MIANTAVAVGWSSIPLEHRTPTEQQVSSSSSAAAAAAAASGTTSSPRLVRPLLYALSSLYGLQQQQYDDDDDDDDPQHPLLSSPSRQQLQQQHERQKRVHDFLIYIQSRNIRRQIQSIHQQYCDSNNNNNNKNHHTADNNHNNSSNNNSRLLNEVVYMGSSWLACLAILLQNHHQGNNHCTNTSTISQSSSSSPQSMFVIQTMLHRCRRVKINEAMDWELEDWIDTNDKVLLLQQYSTIVVGNTNTRCEEPQQQQQEDHHQFTATDTGLLLLNRYIGHMQQMMSPNALYLFQALAYERGLTMMMIPTDSSSNTSSHHFTEEHIKAECTMITLVIVIYQMTLELVHNNNNSNNNSNSNNNVHSTSSSVVSNHGVTTSTTTFDQLQSQNNNNISPLLTMTVSTFATIVFRWWYTQCSLVVAQNQQQQHNSNRPFPSIIVAIRELFDQMKKVTVLQETSPESISYNKIVAFDIALICSVAVLPDAILASPGGARGRLSMDPRAIQIGSTNLRHVETTEFANIVQHAYSTYPHPFMMGYILYACERWVTYLPLNQSTLSIIQSPLQTVGTKNVLSLLIAIYESATWTIDQIISSYIGLSSDQQQQQQQQQQQSNASKKTKQSSRSKKRHKEIVDSHSTDQLRTDAISELQLRGDIAYHVTLHCWNQLCRLSNDSMIQLHHHETNSQGNNNVTDVEGEGPIGCMTACANACLPHLIRHPTMVHGLELFHNISEQIQNICKSSNKSIRALAYESLYTLHAVLLETLNDDPSTLNDSMKNVIVKHFFICAMNLASLCAYPNDYFHHLCLESDHDLEVERNDVRDLLRTVSSSSSHDGGSSEFTNDLSIEILSNLIDACKEGITTSQEGNQVIPETAVHAFSALAKPINYLAKMLYHGAASAQQSTKTHRILITALHILHEVNRFVVDAFQYSTLPHHVLLPLSRTVNIANASFTPFLGVLSSSSELDIGNSIHQALDRMILGAILCVEQIPELAGPSILDHSMYDIRGTMRGPGGEDHVGCLTLMRCATEDHNLTRRVVSSSVPYISRLCELYQQLKHIEIARGPNVVHGQGVTAQTRRILLGTLCSLEVVSEGQLGASSMLNGLFSAAIDGIAQFLPRTSQLSQRELFQITESTLDLVAFTPAIVVTLFTSVDPRFSDCLAVLTASFVNGYQVVSDEGCIQQWNRQRASLFALIKKSSQSTMDISDRGVTMVVACVSAECDAINRQCLAGPTSNSSIFTDDVVSPESIPAGLMIRAIGEIITHSSNNISNNIAFGTSCPAFPNCVRALTLIKSPAMLTITSKCPDPQCHRGSFIDPRPTVTEAWIQAMISIADCYVLSQRVIQQDTSPSEVEILMIDTFVTIVSLFFYSSLGKTASERSGDPGMSMDGPHGLAVMTYFISFFRLGPIIMKWAGERLSTIVPINLESLTGVDGIVDSNLVGIAIIGSALFRACQGALPPWAIESVPEVYCAVFESALSNDVELFGRWIQTSMDIRLHPLLDSNITLGRLQPGQLLSGRYFETMSTPTKMAFVNEAKQLAMMGGVANWKRLKGLIKQVCGGKKKDTDFNQKPSPTRWEFDRV